MAQIFGRHVKTAPNARLPLVSVIVNNYNYACFLPHAIDSALAQTYLPLEVIVVDDGSTDASRDIISGYLPRIRPVLKPNGGQASALNAGFAASRGDVVLFLDADDILCPSAVATAVEFFSEPGTSKVQWPLEVIDRAGLRTGETRPSQTPPEGDFRQQVLERGPSNVASSPTSGNAWRASFLERILPIPEDVPYYRSCADEYLYTLAPVFGRVRTIPQPQGCYRIHGANVYSSRSFQQKLELELAGYDSQCRAMSAALARNRIVVDVNSWKQHSWFHRLSRAVTEILAKVPEGHQFVLIDGNTWGAPREFMGRSVRPFIEIDGEDGGPPADDGIAIGRLEALRESQTPFLVIAWPCFWWLDEYPRWSQSLHAAGRCVLNNDAVKIFDLRQPRSERIGGCIAAISGGRGHA
jgi:glycosyltransferase involved in cell wall biosynthesis